MNIGIILNSLDNNQLAVETILSINSEINNQSKDDYRIFFENINLRVFEPTCAVMNISEIFNYTGILISTTLSNTKLALKTTGDIQRIFYVWDLEWLRREKNYLDNLAVYRNPNIKLVTRSADYAQMIQNYTNRAVDLILPTTIIGRMKECL